MPRRTYKEIYNEAFYAAVENGCDEKAADLQARIAMSDHLSRLADMADDDYKERKLRGKI